VCDVSFTSILSILPSVLDVLAPEGVFVTLVKPQFEAGREQVGKKGVVRDPKVHEEVIRTVLEFAASIGFSIEGLSFSPIKGPEGNIEYLCFLEDRGNAEEALSEAWEAELMRITEDSHRDL